MGLDLSDELVILKVNSMASECHDQPEREWTGAWGKVYFADWSGREGVLAYWDNLNDRARASLKAQFERYAAIGKHNYATDLGNQIQRVSSRSRGGAGNYRACLFRERNTWVITHIYYSMHKALQAKRQCNKAVEIRKEHKERQSKKVPSDDEQNTAKSK